MAAIHNPALVCPQRYQIASSRSNRADKRQRLEDGDAEIAGFSETDSAPTLFLAGPNPKVIGGASMRAAPAGETRNDFNRRATLEFYSAAL